MCLVGELWCWGPARELGSRENKAWWLKQGPSHATALARGAKQGMHVERLQPLKFFRRKDKSKLWTSCFVSGRGQRASQEVTGAHATWVSRTEPSSYQQQFWEVGAIIISASSLGVTAQRDPATGPRSHSWTRGVTFYPGLFGLQPCLPPPAPSCLARCVLPQGSGSAQTQLSGNGPSRPPKPVQGSSSWPTHGLTWAQPCLKGFTYVNSWFFWFFFKILFIYLRKSEQERERARVHKPGGEGEAGSLLSRELNVGLNPRTLGS